MLLPTLVLFIATNVYPVVYGLLISFERRSPWELAGTWVGLHNYENLVWGTEFWLSLGRGLIFGLGSVVLQVTIGLVVALLVRESFRGKSIIITLVLVPYIIPPFAASMMMKWIFNDMFGIANYFLVSLNIIHTYTSWFGSEKAMGTLILANAWQYSMFATLIFLARLMTVNPNLYELGDVMGASYLRKFRDITLPSLKGVFLLVFLLRFIWMFNKFDVIWLLTQGGPLSQTTTLPVLTYIKAFNSYQFGVGAAISTLTFILLAVFSVVYFGVFKPEKEIEV